MIFLLGESYGKKSEKTSLDECLNYVHAAAAFPSDGSDNILAWWKSHDSHFPRLGKLVKKYLSIPATSVPSERLFSAAGRLVTKLRNKLGVKKTDMILFLYKNKGTNL